MNTDNDWIEEIPFPSPPFFDDLRKVNWTPQFTYVHDLYQCADMINQPHEDYPYYVNNTLQVISFCIEQLKEDIYFNENIQLTSNSIKNIHRNIFSNKLGDYAGKWRDCQVRVGYHVPPHYDLLDNLMKQLEYNYYNTDLFTNEKTMVNWYTDFETIHPFIDGNGRVGGVVLAVLSYVNSDGKYYLTPRQ